MSLCARSRRGFPDKSRRSAITHPSVALCSASSLPRRSAPTLRAPGVDDASAQRNEGNCVMGNPRHLPRRWSSLTRASVGAILPTSRRCHMTPLHDATRPVERFLRVALGPRETSSRRTATHRLKRPSIRAWSSPAYPVAVTPARVVRAHLRRRLPGGEHFSHPDARSDSPTLRAVNRRTS